MVCNSPTHADLRQPPSSTPEFVASPGCRPPISLFAPPCPFSGRSYRCNALLPRQILASPRLFSARCGHLKALSFARSFR
ncbi:hypothetical protein L484_016788 [Morus notabilis]|uniref:Uncharacterized protein n=1 Tax=Morus notabilis TaxID=981085 RepID=W9ST95_9ROSA|nr:hypothetical protein L484_016788 [Morus notabilis]